MQLFVTVGNANGESQELTFDVPAPVTWMGIEVEDKSDESKTGRLTVIRQSFVVITEHCTAAFEDTLCELAEGHYPQTLHSATIEWAQDVPDMKPYDGPISEGWKTYLLHKYEEGNPQ